MVGTAVGLLVLLDSSSKPINLVELLIVVAELGHSNVKISRTHATLLFRTLIFFTISFVAILLFPLRFTTYKLQMYNLQYFYYYCKSAVIRLYMRLISMNRDSY